MRDFKKEIEQLKRNHTDVLVPGNQVLVGTTIVGTIPKYEGFLIPGAFKAPGVEKFSGTSYSKNNSENIYNF